MLAATQLTCGLGKRLHRRKQIPHLRLGNAPGDEDETAVASFIRAGARPGFRPRLQFHRRMGEMLHILDHDRAAATDHVEQTLDAQQVGTA